MHATRSRRRRRGTGLAAIALAAGVTLTGWVVPAGAQSATATPAARAASVSTNAIRVIARDSGTHMSYRITGAPRAGLVALHFVNRGRYTHEMSMLRLKKGATLAQFKRALRQPDPFAAAGKLLADPDYSPPGPSEIGPGQQETVVAPLKAGRYVVVCMLPGPDGMPHAMMGMVGAVQVRPGPAHVRAPRIDGTVLLTKHRIVLPAHFKRGGTFAVTNVDTRNPHNLSLVRLRGTTRLPVMFSCVGQAFATGTMVDTCPGTLSGGVADVAPGRTVYLRITFGTGKYGYVSTDGNDFANGLAGRFTVA